ncbi:MAG: NAD(P)-binding domain-containing protein, partial [Alphaproteobacteria bacterium]|nr:NAD(P)-binding domain-containing protein [Alphaproteobacteria bacterium]
MDENPSGSNAYQSVGILGAGACITALAFLASRQARSVTLWTRNPSIAANLNVAHSRISATTEWSSLTTCEVLLLAIPAQALRATLLLLKVARDAVPPLV